MPASTPLLVLGPVDGRGADSAAAGERVEALFREHYRALVGFAMHYTRTRDAAEDAVQEVFLRVWQQWERDGAVEVTRSYLLSAVRFQVLPMLKRERVAHGWLERTTRELPLERGAAAQVNGAIERLESDDLTRAVTRAVAGLSEKTRTVFLLSRQRGLTYAEIAQVLGISVKTVELHMTRALKALRAGLRGLVVALAVLAARAGGVGPLLDALRGG